MEAVQNAPKYFREAGYRCPTEPRDGLMQYAFKTKLTTFEFFGSIPWVLKDFNTFMGNTMGGRRYWTDWFPVQERLLDGANETSALLVDIGGGKGHDVLAFLAKYPEKGRRLILQDLAPVVSDLEGIDPGIERMTCDFFTEQPVQGNADRHLFASSFLNGLGTKSGTGARVYFFHHIFHDWSDKYCLKILEQVRKAMAPGYSKLIVHELIIPEQNADRFSVGFDMIMMAFNSGMERTERQWKGLLSRAGFKHIRVWPAPEAGADGVVEAMVEEQCEMR